MFISQSRCGYIGTEQYASGDFLIVFDRDVYTPNHVDSYDPATRDFTKPLHRLTDVERREVRVLVRKIALRQCGHWMMGAVKLCGHRISLSGTYGSDGLPHTLTIEQEDALWGRLHPLPAELLEAFWKGGGHNSAGSEGPLLHAWAKENLAVLKHLRK
jgi:hypothetical protein